MLNYYIKTVSIKVLIKYRHTFYEQKPLRQVYTGQIMDRPDVGYPNLIIRMIIRIVNINIFIYALYYILR